MQSRWSRGGLVSLVLLVAACSAQPLASEAPASETPASEAPISAPSATATATPTPVPEPTAAAGTFPASLVADLVVQTDEVFMEPVECAGRPDCTVPLDILAPAGAEALPTIVLVPGGPMGFLGRRYLEALAAAVARRGAVVFLVSYRSTATRNVGDDTMHDVRCAIRYARSVTSDHGGDPNTLVLAGHSFGSEISLRIAVEPDTESSSCLAEGSGVPDAVVAIAGFSVNLTVAGESGPPIQMIGGSDDPESGIGESTAQRIRDAGFSAEYLELEGIDHFEIIEPEANPIIVDIIFGAT